MKHVLTVILAGLAALMLLGCSAAAPETAATDANVRPVSSPAPLPTDEEAEEPTRPGVQFPENDAATGTLKFYFGDKAIYAGGMVSDIVALGVETVEDLSQLIQPGQISGNISARVVQEDVAWADRPVFFFYAINPYQEAKPLEDCVIYGITVSMEDGIRFGSGNEAVPFVSGKTTRQEIESAYGDPDYSDSDSKVYYESAYYKPFNTVFFSFRKGVVRQIMTCYSAYLYEDLAAQYPHELKGFFGNDALILMSRYLDVTPYLNRTGKEELTPTSVALEESILLGTDRINFDCKVSEMPERFSKPYIELKIQTPINENIYIRNGVVNREEFYLINRGGMTGGLAIHARVKGVITQNRYYTNWDQDLSGFLDFDYMGLKPQDRIEDVLEKFGMPSDMLCTSSPKACFVWLHYVDASKNTLQICVDPMTDQIIELKAAKYYNKEATY